MIDILPGRTGESAVGWFGSHLTEWLGCIRWAVFDISGASRMAYERIPPAARQVADAFEIIRLANQRVDDVRRSVQDETLGYRGRKGDPLHRIRRLPTAAHENVSHRGQIRQSGHLDAGDPHREVRTAWHAKETARDIYNIESPVLALQYTLQLADDCEFPLKRDDPSMLQQSLTDS